MQQFDNVRLMHHASRIPHMEQSTILIIDDDPASVNVLIEYLQGSGFKTMAAPNGERALRQLHLAQPDLILLDVLMPGMDGFETCRRLKEHRAFRDIPVIFMTALSDTVDKVKGFERGAVDYLTKPVQHKEVLARINAHLTIRKLQQQLREQNLRLEKQNTVLEEQNERFRKLSEATFEGILIHDKGLILEINQTLEHMFGYQRSEMIGRNMLDFVAPTSRDEVLRHVRIDEEYPPVLNEVEGYEVKAMRKDGTIFPVMIQAKMMPYQGRNVMVAAVRDLSWQRAMEEKNVQLQQENKTLRSTMKDRYKFGEIIGRSLAMQKVYEQIVHAAASDANVVISGESGTGKELVAHTIHELSDRKNQTFMPVNCGAIPETLFETEFFGHRKGSFTGASGNKRGFFDIANHGTLFLDEVGELTLIMQVKLLRAIETKEYTPLGSTTPLKTDVRIISATNRDLMQSLQQGLLREDFLYRIHVIPIHIPPLRERREDIPLLVDHFLELYCKDEKSVTVPGKILDELYNHDWPGNIRELQNVLKRYITLNRLDFFRSHRAPQPMNPNIASWETFLQDKLTLRDIVEALEKEFIANALRVNRWNKIKTAKMLGVPERTLYRKLKQYQL